MIINNDVSTDNMQDLIMKYNDNQIIKLQNLKYI